MTYPTQEDPSDILKTFLSYNRSFFGERRKGIDTKGNVLVNASYRNEFLLASTMKIARAVADVLDMGILVLPHFAFGKRSTAIIRSYNPTRILNIRLPMLRETFRRFRTAFKVVRGLSTGEDLVALKINEVPVGIHIYDYLLRKLGLSTLKNLTFSMKFRILIELLYYFAIVEIFSSNQPSFVLLPDNAYREGMIFELVKKEKLPGIVGIDLNGVSMHKFDSHDSYDAHCRTPDISIVSKIIQTPLLMERAVDYFQNRFSGQIPQHDVMRAFDPSKKSVNRETLAKNYGIEFGKKIVLVMAHVFRDAPHAYPGLLFRDYEEWLVSTCAALSSNKNVSFLVKGHPSADLYDEIGLTETILAHNGFEKAFLPDDVNTSSLFHAVDVVVTCGGTAGMEFPCFGVPVLVAARPSYANFSYVISPPTREEYFSEIERLHLLSKLSDEQIREARAVLFTIQSVMQVPKREIGLGSQEFYMGAELDIGVFMREMISDCVNPEGYERLKSYISRLLRGPERNLIDLSKIEVPAGLSNVLY